MKITTKSGGVSGLNKGGSKPSKQDADRPFGTGRIKSTARDYGRVKVSPSPSDKGSYGTGPEC